MNKEEMELVQRLINISKSQQNIITNHEQRLGALEGKKPAEKKPDEKPSRMFCV